MSRTFEALTESVENREEAQLEHKKEIAWG